MRAHWRKHKAMLSLARGANYTHHWTAMAAASFCPSLPQQFKPASISKLPQTSFSFRVFSSQKASGIYVCIHFLFGLRFSLDLDFVISYDYK